MEMEKQLEWVLGCFLSKIGFKEAIEDALRGLNQDFSIGLSNGRAKFSYTCAHSNIVFEINMKYIKSFKCILSENLM